MFRSAIQYTQTPNHLVNPPSELDWEWEFDDNNPRVGTFCTRDESDLIDNNDGIQFYRCEGLRHWLRVSDRGRDWACNSCADFNHSMVESELQAMADGRIWPWCSPCSAAFFASNQWHRCRCRTYIPNAKSHLCLECSDDIWERYFDEITEEAERLIPARTGFPQPIIGRANGKRIA